MVSFSHAILYPSQVLDETVASLDPKKAIHSRLAALEWISRCVAKSKPSVDPATLVALAR